MDEGTSGPPLRVLVRQALRFLGLTCVMGCGIAILLAVEAAVLWRLGIDYIPRTAVATAGVAGFAIDDSGRWAVSRIVYQRQSRDESLQNEIVLHDMRCPDRPIRLGEVVYPRHLVFSAQSDRFAVGCYDGRILTGRARTGERSLRQLAKLPRGPSYQLACSRDGQLLAAADGHGIYLWRMPDGDLLRRLPHTSGEMKLLLFADDGQRLLSIGSEGHVCLWEVSGDRLLHSHHLNLRVKQAQWLVDGREVLLVLAGNEARQRVLDLQTGELRELESRLTRYFDGPLAVSRDGATLATVRYLSPNGYCLELWEARTGRRLREVGGGEGSVNGLLFTADGTLYSWDSRGRLTGWHPDEQRPVWRFCALQWARNEPALQLSRLEREAGQTGGSSAVAAGVHQAERFGLSEKSEFNAGSDAFERMDLQPSVLADRRQARRDR